MENIKEHFEIIAKDYDYWKNKNKYYYIQLKHILKERIPPAKKVLEIGCGTGDLLIALEPSYGLGVDISENMILLAKKKHHFKNIEFKVSSAEHLKSKEKFDVIFLADVIEHLENVDQMSEALNSIATKDTLILITMINPLWELLLLLMEKFNLKMPEGPHKRLTFQELKEIFNKHNLNMICLDYRTLFPKNIPYLSGFVNNHFYKIPLLRNLGLIQILTLKKL